MDDFLAPYREKIDQFNLQILELLVKRAEVVLEIGALKKQQHLPFRDKKREEKMLQQLQQQGIKPLSEQALQKIFEAIFSTSLALQTEEHLTQESNVMRDKEKIRLMEISEGLLYHFYKREDLCKSANTPPNPSEIMDTFQEIYAGLVSLMQKDAEKIAQNYQPKSSPRSQSFPTTSTEEKEDEKPL